MAVNMALVFPPAGPTINTCFHGAPLNVLQASLNTAHLAVLPHTALLPCVTLHIIAALQSSCVHVCVGMLMLTRMHGENLQVVFFSSIIRSLSKCHSYRNQQGK